LKPFQLSSIFGAEQKGTEEWRGGAWRLSGFCRISSRKRQKEVLYTNFITLKVMWGKVWRDGGRIDECGAGFGGKDRGSGWKFCGVQGPTHRILETRFIIAN